MHSYRLKTAGLAAVAAMVAVIAAGCGSKDRPAAPATGANAPSPAGSASPPVFRGDPRAEVPPPIMPGPPQTAAPK